MINLMFDEENIEKHIGPLKKDSSVDDLKEASDFFLKEMEKYPTETSYDCTAREFPYFKTINYTEYAGCLLINPLQQELRVQQIYDAMYDDVEIKTDFIPSFVERVNNKGANKYSDRKDPTMFKKNLVVLPGSNVLKKLVCLNKLKRIADSGDVVFKPHPITIHAIIGELKDTLGDKNVVDRDEDIYPILLAADKIYTSHVSETALYSVCLGKQTEPIDDYRFVEAGSFFNINRFLFTQKDPKGFINKIMNSCKSGLISPTADPDWKDKIIGYLEYIHKERNKYDKFYIEPDSGKRVSQTAN
jgi:hypothetical protein